MAEWTEQELVAYGEKLLDLESQGICPFSGETIKECYSDDLCDCSLGSVPVTCDECELVIWDLQTHKLRQHDRSG